MSVKKSERLKGYVIGLEQQGVRVHVQLREPPSQERDSSHERAWLQGTREGVKFSIRLSGRWEWLELRRKRLTLPAVLPSGRTVVSYTNTYGTEEEAKHICNGLTSLLIDNGAVVWPLVDICEDGVGL